MITPQVVLLPGAAIPRAFSPWPEYTSKSKRAAWEGVVKLLAFWLVLPSSVAAPLIQPLTYRSWASLKLSRMAAFLVFLRCIAFISAEVRSRLASRCTRSIAECSSSSGDVGGTVLSY